MSSNEARHKKIEIMKAKDLKVGSVIKVNSTVPFEAIIYRVSNTFVWYNGSGTCRIGRTTIDNFSSFYQIISI
jgi:hypothetical protein